MSAPNVKVVTEIFYDNDDEKKKSERIGLTTVLQISKYDRKDGEWTTITLYSDELHALKAGIKLLEGKEL